MTCVPPELAANRAVSLPELLTYYDQPLMTVDADASFTGSPRALFEHLDGQDLVMNAARGLNTPRAYLAAVPWRHVTAQLFLAAQSRALSLAVTNPRALAEHAQAYRQKLKV